MPENPNTKRVGNVVFVENFHRCEPDDASAADDPYEGYEKVDDDTGRIGRRIVNRLRNLPPNDYSTNLGFGQKFQSETTNVRQHKVRRGTLFTVDLNARQQAMITRGPDSGYHADAPLRQHLEQFYFATVLGFHLLHKEHRICPVKPVSEPRFGDSENNVVLTNERWLRITTWRAAAGLGLTAVAQGRPALRQTLHQYLSEQVYERYITSMRVTEADESALRYALFDRLPYKVPILPDELIGLGNPLNRLEFNNVTSLPADG